MSEMEIIKYDGRRRCWAAAEKQQIAVARALPVGMPQPQSSLDD